ncbi:MAG: hypothetical protein ABI645_13355 [Pseudomonadota bacterium]
MNCQGVAHLIDSGNFSAIDAADRHDAEAHAQQCRHCAPLWFTHSRLAVSPVHAMPPDLSRRCLALVTAAGKIPAPHRAPRLVVVITSLVGLAAAASMLGVGLSSKLAPQHELVTGFAVPPVSTMPRAGGDPSAAPEQQMPAATQAASITQQGIPVFPPQHAADQIFEARRKMALDKFVDLHPEVTQALPGGTLYDGMILLRADGKVLDHSIRIVAPGALHWTRNDPHRGLPNDGGELFGDYLPKGAPLAGGRALGADLSLRDVVVRNSYDPARSSLRVEEIVRKQRAELMAPATETGGSHLTLLLSAAGAIQREVAGHIDKDAIQEKEDWNVSKRAEAMAGLFGVSKDEIGLMGSVPVYDMDTERGVVVDYAWQRLPGESAPEYHQGGGGSPTDEGVDFATAVALVERVMPEAFTAVELERSQGIPTILLTEKGEFIRTARFRGSSLERAFPGISLVAVRLLALNNGNGSKAGVYFIWQGTPRGIEPSGAPAATTR